MKVLVGVLTLAMGLSAFAQQTKFQTQQKNPQIRACNLTEGVFHSVKVASANDEYGYCQYGSAMMDSISLMTVIAALDKTSAVSAYERTANTPANSCEDANASTVSGVDSDGNKFDICLFGDKSSIELGTLRAGKSAPENAGLTRAVDTRIR